MGQRGFAIGRDSDLSAAPCCTPHPMAMALDRGGYSFDANDAPVSSAADEAVQQSSAPDYSTGPSSPETHAGGASPLIRYRQPAK